MGKAQLVERLLEFSATAAADTSDAAASKKHKLPEAEDSADARAGAGDTADTEPAADAPKVSCCCWSLRVVSASVCLCLCLRVGVGVVGDKSWYDWVRHHPSAVVSSNLAKLWLK